MFTVIGGTYFEVCLNPAWREVYGSGGRAAAAASRIVEMISKSRVLLRTCAEGELESQVRDTAASFGYDVEITPRDGMVEFQYIHGLSAPKLYQSRPGRARINLDRVETECALVFGMVEASPSVEANQIVFDPQSGELARLPSKEEISAKRLAIVANLKEARAMLQAVEPHSAPQELNSEVLAKSLLRLAGCEVVVVKNATEGAVVCSDGNLDHIPSVPIPTVFPIGSGDVFSSIFAAYWTVAGATPLDSARKAAAATALYCATRALPVPASPHLSAPKMTKVLVPPKAPKKHRAQVYLAGPFFNLPQLWLLNEARAALEEQGLVVFSPRDHVGELTHAKDMTKIADADIKGLVESDLVFALVDGFDPGTIFELGFARALKKPAVVFVSDLDPRHITMIEGSNCHVFRDFPTAIYQAAWMGKLE